MNADRNRRIGSRESHHRERSQPYARHAPSEYPRCGLSCKVAPVRWRVIRRVQPTELQTHSEIVDVHESDDRSRYRYGHASQAIGHPRTILSRSCPGSGKTVGIGATALEANAALWSIVRRDSGESYETFLHGFAAASGIATPTLAELARLDRKQPKIRSNDDWTHPLDRDAKITKMKGGRTHLAHKAEHGVDRGAPA